MSLDALARKAQAVHLEVFGALHTLPADDIGDGTLVLLGPAEPGFWAHVSESPEFTDGAPDPLDRWSARVISVLADEMDGTAFFPFGTPLRPFMSWALRSGRAWSSPVRLLVHDHAGLMVSFRGAVLLRDRLTLPPTGPFPCETCIERPCLTACPVGALTGADYDLDRCHDFLDRAQGTICMSQGCAVRHSCPAGHKYRRVNAQSAFHMERFHPCR